MGLRFHIIWIYHIIIYHKFISLVYYFGMIIGRRFAGGINVVFDVDVLFFIYVLYNSSLNLGSRILL